MPFDDFLVHFTEMSICRLINTSYFSMSKTWKEARFFGSWSLRKGSEGEKNYQPNRAGGCLNHRDTFLNNPQYRFDIPRVEEGDEDPQEIIVQLSQSDARSALLTDKKENKTIGFHIRQVETNRTCRLHRLPPDSEGETSDYIKTKHIFLRTNMPKTGGRYVIIPTTFNPEETTNFLLRVFTEHQANVKELSLDKPITPWYKQCCVDEHVLVTRITVVGAKGLENNETFGKVDPYCFIKCEGQVARSWSCKDNLNPMWNFSVIFFRRNPSRPIKIQIWNNNLVVDSFIGQAMLLAPPQPEVGEAGPREENLTLVGRKRKRTEMMPGEVKVYVESYEDLLRF